MGMLVCGVDGRWSMVGWSDGFMVLFFYLIFFRPALLGAG